MWTNTCTREHMYTRVHACWHTYIIHTCTVWGRTWKFYEIYLKSLLCIGGNFQHANQDRTTIVFLRGNLNSDCLMKSSLVSRRIRVPATGVSSVRLLFRFDRFFSLLLDWCFSRVVFEAWCSLSLARLVLVEPMARFVTKSKATKNDKQ